MPRAGTEAPDISLALARTVPRRRFWGVGLTVDAVWIDGGDVLLVRRGRSPFRGRWALPGGFVEANESVEQAVRRELLEETGLRARPVALVGVYSEPGRDPRGPVASLAFRMAGRRRPPRGGDDASESAWVPIRDLPRLAFDHGRMLADARRRRSGRGS